MIRSGHVVMPWRHAVARYGLAVALLTMGAVLPLSVGAAPYDISLRGIGRPQVDGAGIALAGDAAAGRFRSLALELATSLTPRPLTTAETLGVSGFEYSIATTLADISESQGYWQGQPGWPVFEGATSTSDHTVPTMFWIPSLHLRKGLPYSTEIGASGSYLALSQMFMLGADFKVALHESFFPGVPSIAARAQVSTLFGASDLVVTTAETDIIASFPIGLQGLVRITPYVGAGLMFVDATSDVIDSTPYDDRDQSGGPRGSLYTFDRLNWRDNSVRRLVAGVRAQIMIFVASYEINLSTIPSTGDLLQSHSLLLGFDT